MRNILPVVLLLVAAALGLAAVPPSSLPRAIAEQEALLDARPSDAQAYNDYGNLLLLAGREEAAEAAYRRAVELAPGLTSARFNLALLLEQRGALKEAREQLKIVVEAIPRHAWAHFQLGRIAERQGREADAVGHYAEAFRLEPSLSFPEVNPQVIDSDLVTRALLETRAGDRTASEAPRIYEQPGRIASLLLPTLPAERAEPATERPADPTAPGPVTPGAAVESEPASGEQPRILKPGDLQPGSRVGEATPPVPERPQPGAPPGNDAWSQRYRQQVLRQQELQRQQEAGQGYQPGTPSTGQSRLQIRNDR